MRLRPPKLTDVIIVGAWRNSCMESLRTPTYSTQITQTKFFDKTMNSDSNRYYVIENADMVAFGGITDIETENGLGEISLLVKPHLVGSGVGEESVELLLNHAFNKLRLQTVYGECYSCNEKGLKFWQKICKKYKARVAVLPNRKFWEGKFYDSLYFSIDATVFRSGQRVQSGDERTVSGLVGEDTKRGSGSGAKERQDNGNVATGSDSRDEEVSEGADKEVVVDKPGHIPTGLQTCVGSSEIPINKGSGTDTVLHTDNRPDEDGTGIET